MEAYFVVHWLGRSREEVLGRRMTDFLEPDGHVLFERSFSMLLRDGRLDDFEFELLDTSGVRRWMLGNATIACDIGGEFLMTRTVTTDITELKRVREALQHLSAQQQQIIDTDLVGILQLKHRRIVWANKGAERLLGYAPGQLLEQSIRLLDVEEGDHRRVFEAAHALMQEGKAYRCQMQLKRRNGMPVWIDLSTSALPTRQGDVLCLLVDISALKRAEDIRSRTQALEAENRQLVEASRVKGLFLSNISHELYTPLNAIIGYSHVLGTGTVGPESPRFGKYVDAISQSGQKLLELIQSMLNFADVESGRIDLRLERISLQQLLRNVADIAEPASRARRIGVAVEVDEEIGAIVADELRLVQIVSHFLSNAIKFSHDGGQVAVRGLAAGPDHFRIEVQDHGIGIAADDLPHLFTAFRQLDDGLAKAYQGAGLSLALARRLVEAQGGEVTVDSRPHQGSVFSFTLARIQE